MTDTTFETTYDLMMRTILPTLASFQKAQLDEVAQLEELRAAVEHALSRRIAFFEAMPITARSPYQAAELARLRSLAGLVPSLTSTPLHQVFGQVAIDGRPGDYVTLLADLPQKERIGQLVSTALTIAESPSKWEKVCSLSSTCTIKVARPATEAVRVALIELGLARGWTAAVQWRIADRPIAMDNWDVFDTITLTKSP